jgi:hypothetical protein
MTTLEQIDAGDGTLINIRPFHLVVHLYPEEDKLPVGWLSIGVTGQFLAKLLRMRTTIQQEGCLHIDGDAPQQVEWLGPSHTLYRGRRTLTVTACGFWLHAGKVSSTELRHQHLLAIAEREEDHAGKLPAGYIWRDDSIFADPFEPARVADSYMAHASGQMWTVALRAGAGGKLAIPGASIN